MPTPPHDPRLLAIASIADALLLLAVIASLIPGNEARGAQLLLKAITVWTTNTIAARE